jgi:hypothetical protein
MEYPEVTRKPRSTARSPKITLKLQTHSNKSSRMYRSVSRLGSVTGEPSSALRLALSLGKDHPFQMPPKAYVPDD